MTTTTMTAAKACCCGICGEAGSSLGRKIYCPACVSYLLLNERLSFVNSSMEKTELQKQADSVLVHDLAYSPSVDVVEKSSRRHVRLVKSRIERLKSKTRQINEARQALQNDTHRRRADIESLRADNDSKKDRLKKMHENLDSQYEASRSQLVAKTEARRDAITTVSTSIEELTSRRIKELALLFGIRKRRKKREKGIVRTTPENDSSASLFAQRFDLVIEFSVLPDLTKLVHYNASSVNMALERLAWFVALLANYLRIQLPYELALPQRSHPYIRMGNASRNVKHSLYLKHSVGTLAQNYPQEFESFAEGLAMLSCCLAKIANHQGIPVTTIEDHPQVNKIVSKLYRTLVPRNEERVPRSTTPDLGPSPAASVGDISEQLQLSSIRDYIITQSYVELNGESSEWNLVDIEATIGSLVDIPNNSERRTHSGNHNRNHNSDSE